MTPGLPEKLSATVHAELARIGGSGAGGAGIADVTAAWPGCVGGTIAENAWPARYTRDGTLIVHASSSTWAFELTQLEEMIRDRLGELAPARISFIVGALPAPGFEPVSASEQSFHGPTQEARAKAAEIACAIEDSALRELAERAVAAALSQAPERSRPTGGSGRLVDG